jgi:isopenicillin-N N-acyltransferase-like protein
MPIPVKELQGRSQEIGYQHGNLLGEEIRNNLSFYLGLWKDFCGVTPDQVLKDVEPFLFPIENFDKELIEEMEGIGKGAGLKLEEIAVLNARWELNYAYMPKTVQGASGGCTSFSLLPSVAEGNTTYIGQNWDYKPPQEPQLVILKIERENKPTIVINTEAGIIGHKGFNSAGIGIALNYIRSHKDAFAPGVPYLLKARGVLNCEQFSDCLKIHVDNPGPNSGNMMLAHKDGETIDAECHPEGVNFLYPEGGVLTHANHFESMRFHDVDEGRTVLVDTLYRSPRLRRLLLQQPGPLTVEKIQKCLKDHFGYPNALCRHRDPRQKNSDQWETLTSMIIDLRKSTMWYTSGPPCKHEYEMLSLK